MAWGVALHRTVHTVGKRIGMGLRAVGHHVGQGLRAAATVAQKVDQLQPVYHSKVRPLLQSGGVNTSHIDRGLGLFNAHKHHLGQILNTYDGLRNALGR
jgi:hypothetical protein